MDRFAVCKPHKGDAVAEVAGAALRDPVTVRVRHGAIMRSAPMSNRDAQEGDMEVLEILSTSTSDGVCGRCG